MSIYPNPTDGEFAIKVATDNCTIEIYNIIGEVILKRSEAPLHSHINNTKIKAYETLTDYTYSDMTLLK